jgi:hypothetical protein
MTSCHLASEVDGKHLFVDTVGRGFTRRHSSCAPCEPARAADTMRLRVFGEGDDVSELDGVIIGELSSPSRGPPGFQTGARPICSSFEADPRSSFLP